MRTVLLAGFATLAVSLAPLAAHAMSVAAVAPGGESGVTLVEGGCGPGGYRASNGLCYRYRRPMPPPRMCPPRFHFAPRFGRCVPNY